MAGLDEAGRGPLAGPVSLGLASFPPALFRCEQSVPESLAALDDSKNLKPAVREALLQPVRDTADFATAVHISNKLVDAMGIAGALEYGMIRAIRRAEIAGHRPRVVLVDGNYKLAGLRAAFPDIHFECVVKGDSRVFSIAAASILAKVTRDRRMDRFAKLFPDYGLERHKGYGTQLHRQRIQELGPCPIHRRSYRW